MIEGDRGRAPAILRAVLSETAPTARRFSRAWLLLIPLACVEFVGSLVVRARVPDASDWDVAAQAVAAEWEVGDAVTIAPRWADPLLREAMGRALGERFDRSVAGSPGLDGDARLWAFSIRGHDSPLLAEGTLEHEATYGRVRVERRRLPNVEVHFDFVDALEHASATRGERACNLGRAHASGGGLGAGPVIAASRFSCGGDLIGETVIEDLDFEARRCISMRPSGTGEVTLRYDEVPLGDRLVLYAGLHWVDERHHIEPEHEGAPVMLSVRAGERSLAELTHRDGDGWARYAVSVPAELVGTTQSVSFVVTSAASHDRSFCWAGRSLGGAP